MKYVDHNLEFKVKLLDQLTAAAAATPTDGGAAV